MLLTRCVPILILCAMLLGGSGCGQKSSKAKPEKVAPAKVEAHPDEGDIFRVTLTPKAVERLGITIVPIERRTIPRFRSVGGIITVPPGQSLIISAPVTGRVEVQKDKSLPKPGMHVEKDDPLLLLMPLLSPERDVPTPAERVQIANAQVTLKSAQIAAAGDVERSNAEMKGAEITLKRAEQLLADKAGSARAVDDARAALEVVKKTWEAAVERKQALDALSLESDAEEAQPVPILSPDSGTLMNVSVSRGQTVTMGTPLFDLADLETMWIRVPLYAGQVDEIRRDQPVQVQNLHHADAKTPQTAQPVEAPPSGDALAASVDLFYEIDNKSGDVRPGERVTVQLPLKGETDALVVPLAAVVHDANGTSWVYGQESENVFRRHRVFLKYALPDPDSDQQLAVLSSGPDVGTKIVVEGVAELFGTEFGTGK